MSIENIAALSREELLELCQIYAKNWLAMDGLWFQSIEAKYDMAEAIEHDGNMWGHFTVIEARRLKAFLGLPEQSGIEGLKKALTFRVYATLNEDEITVDGNTLTYRVRTCRVQHARTRKGMDYFPCKPVGLIEYGGFAREIDPRFTVEAVSCHPDVTDPDCHCCWRFTLNTD